MKITFLGGAKVVTGANYLLEINGHKILVECGLFQGSRELTELNWEPFHFDPKEIEYVFLTHSHLDHVGRLPKLVHEGFRGTIICTPPTAEIMHASLEDSARVLNHTAMNMQVPPLYNEADVEEMMHHVKPTEYGKKIDLFQGLAVVLHNAGHILGSTMYELQVTESGVTKKLLFTGDLGNCPNPLLPNTEMITEADYVFIESAYGDRNHETGTDKVQQLRQAIIDIVKRKGTLLIPSFAIERTQELLYHINDMVESKQIPEVPIFIDSPLAIKITDIYRRFGKYFNIRTQSIIRSGDDIFNFPLLRFCVTKEESKSINHVMPPKIIIAGSGMSTGGRILHHEKMYLDNPQNMFLVVGFQVDGTVGQKIMRGEPVIDIMGERIKNKIEMRAIGGFSAHADQRQLVSFISNFMPEPRKIFIVQGEVRGAEGLRKALKEQLGVENVYIPTYEETIEL